MAASDTDTSGEGEWSIDDNGRFCSHCGAANTAVDNNFGGSEKEFIQRSAITRGGQGLWPMVAGVVVVVGLAILLTRAPGNPDTLPVGGSIQDDLTATTAGQDADGVTSIGDEVTPDTSITVAVDGVGIESAGSGPALGREVGFSLWFRGITGLQQLDLNTLDTTTFDLLDASPIYAHDGWLVLAGVADARSSIFAVPVDDPEHEAVDLGDGTYWPPSAKAGPAPGTIWMINVAPTRQSAWHLIRLADGDVLSELPAEPLYFLAFQVGPEVASSRDGGIFEWQDGEYRRVAEGTMLAASDELVLAQNCETPSVCNQQWLDRSTWEPVNRPLPAGFRGDGFSTTLSPGGRILIEQSTTRLEVFDLDNGSNIDLPLDLWDASRLAVSPDERYVAVVAGLPILQDLDTGETYQLEIPVADEWVLFVDNG